ncbi:MAG: hypothetical protein LBE82_02475 [Chitinophagaceae bacterium]|nr:hypothetical protein [Chitinophagaceae bacterium]
MKNRMLLFDEPSRRHAELVSASPKTIVILTPLLVCSVELCAVAYQQQILTGSCWCAAQHQQRRNFYGMVN